MADSGGSGDDGPRRGVDEWLQRNLDEHIDRGRRVSRAHREPGAGSGGPGRAEPTAEGGNLVQLPDGATFGTDTRPSPQQREDLARHAARIEDEMLHLHPNSDPTEAPDDQQR